MAQVWHLLDILGDHLVVDSIPFIFHMQPDIYDVEHLNVVVSTETSC